MSRNSLLLISLLYGVLLVSIMSCRFSNGKSSELKITERYVINDTVQEISIVYYNGDKLHKASIFYPNSHLLREYTLKYLPQKDTIVLHGYVKLYYPSGMLSDRKEKYLGGNLGSRYSYYPNGAIKRYSFYHNIDRQTYLIKFDTAGHVTKELGRDQIDPILIRYIDEDPDTLIIDYSFVDIPFLDKDVVVYLNDSLYDSIPCANGGIMQFKFSKMELENYWIRVIYKEDGKELFNKSKYFVNTKYY